MSHHLQHGSSGASVVAVQQALAGLGYDLDVDGQFGNATDATVRHLQERHGLDADGVVGPHTRATLGL